MHMTNYFKGQTKYVVTKTHWFLRTALLCSNAIREKFQIRDYSENRQEINAAGYVQPTHVLRISH